MLILTRRQGEKLRIGDGITISVVGKKGSQIRLGIDAPQEVSVHREEIYERIKNTKVDPQWAKGAKGESGVSGENVINS